MSSSTTRKTFRWFRRAHRCWQCLAETAANASYCPHCGAAPTLPDRLKKKRDGGDGQSSPLPTFLCILAAAGVIGLIISVARDSAGSSAGQNPFAASSNSQPTATARSVAASNEEPPPPTPTEELKQRSPRDIPDDAVQGSVGTIRTGDSLEIVVGKRTYLIELAGIVAPEPASMGDECFGDDAKERLGELLEEGTPIWVSPDPATLPPTATFEGYAWTWGLFGSNARFVNEELVRGGYARFSSPAPDMGFDEPRRLLQAQADAKLESAGLWEACA